MNTTDKNLKIPGGFTLLPDGEAVVDPQAKRCGLNRFKYYSQRCATAFLFFSNRQYKDQTAEVAFAISKKTFAPQIAFFSFTCEEGIGLFLYDWLLDGGKNVYLRGDGKGDFEVLVEPYHGYFLFYYSLLFANFGKLKQIIYNEPFEDFYLINSNMNAKKSFGRKKSRLLTRKEVDLFDGTENEFLKRLLRVNEDVDFEIGDTFITPSTDDPYDLYEMNQDLRQALHIGTTKPRTYKQISSRVFFKKLKKTEGMRDFKVMFDYRKSK